MAAAKSTRSTASSSARKAATGAAKSAAKSAAKGTARAAAKGATKGASKAATKAAAAGGDRLGRGTRWTEEQVKLLMETVASSQTAKDAFEKVARELGKSAGTVAQKYYNMQKATSGGAKRKPGRPAGSTSTAARTTAAPRAARASSGGGLPSATDLRILTVDELVGLATRVKGEVDRRRSELDAAAKALAG